MNGGGAFGFKVCPECQRQIELTAVACPGCGHRFRQNFVQSPIQNQGSPSHSPFQSQSHGVQSNMPPHVGQPQNPTQAFYGFQQVAQGHMLQEDPAMLAMRFLDSRRLALWTFWIGLFCLWPLWILTYLEYQKMQSAKEQIARQGGNVMAWMQSYGLRDLV